MYQHRIQTYLKDYFHMQTSVFLDAQLSFPILLVRTPKFSQGKLSCLFCDSDSAVNHILGTCPLMMDLRIYHYPQHLLVDSSTGMYSNPNLMYEYQEIKFPFYLLGPTKIQTQNCQYHYSCGKTLLEREINTYRNKVEKYKKRMRVRKSGSALRLLFGY